jgi:hypothetical protein
MPRRSRHLPLACCVALALLLQASPPAAAQTVSAVHQFGTSADDGAVGIASDGSSLYVCGGTAGTFPGQTRAGHGDAFAEKMDVSGNLIWAVQFGSTRTELVSGCAVDPSGLYIVGSTKGEFPGDHRHGGYDVFLQKIALDGTLKWSRQVGTSADEFATAITVGASGVAITGGTSGTLPSQTALGSNDAFVMLFSDGGRRTWIRQFGTSAGDGAFGVTAKGTSLYVVGMTQGDLARRVRGSDDAFIRRYSARGNEVWTKQFGSTNQDWAEGAAVDSGGVYVAGLTTGALPGQTFHGGTIDAFVRKYAPDGSEVWTSQVGSADDDVAFAIASDGINVFAVGATDGAGGHDAVLWEFPTDGSMSSSLGFGTPALDEGHGVAILGGHAYPVGWTSGTFPGATSAGGEDAYLADVT